MYTIFISKARSVGRPPSYTRPARKEREEPRVTSPYIKRNRQLLTHLLKRGALTEIETEQLCWYRHYHMRSKRDMGAIQSTLSVIGKLSSQHFGSTRFYTEKENQDSTEELMKFREVRHHLCQRQKKIVDFSEDLFDYPHNDLAYFKTFSAPEQAHLTKTIKRFAELVLRAR